MLTGKIALVTGAGRGIGRQIALTLAQNHAHVIVNYNGSKQSAEQVVTEIAEAGGSAEAMQCNVADANAGNAMVKDIIAKHGKVDILVNNAGITRDNLIMRMTDQEFEDVLNTNLKGAFYMIRSLSRNFLKQRSGKIINIASVVGITGNAGQANYSASKAGVIGLTKSVAREFDRDDTGFARGCSKEPAADDSYGKSGNCTECCRSCTVSGRQRFGLYYRTGHWSKWRYGDVIDMAEKERHGKEYEESSSNRNGRYHTDW